MFMYQAEIIIIISIISRYLLPILFFAWGGRRGITGTVNFKKAPHPQLQYM